MAAWVTFRKGRSSMPLPFPCLACCFCNCCSGNVLGGLRKWHTLLLVIYALLLHLTIAVLLHRMPSNTLQGMLPKMTSRLPLL